MSHRDRPLLLLTAGEPAGIGPDICLSLLCEPPANADVAVCVDTSVLAERAKQLNLPQDWPTYDHNERQNVSVMHFPMAAPVVAGKPDGRNAKAVVDMLRQAAALASSGQADALVTAPVAKEVLSKAHSGFTGHTEFFAAQAGVEVPVMAFVGPRLRLALVTTHLPLAKVAAAITVEQVVAVLQVADTGMREVLGGAQPHWIVCGLNPHAGEGGLLGCEEVEVIAPAIKQACEAGIEAQGPVPADTAFLPQRISERTCVLAMYHDQALPVAKRDDFAATVNVTFGLPYVRTSVDHGTAFELAGTGQADASSLRAAVELAARVATSRMRQTQAA